MATALKLKNDINKLKAALRSKATPKSFLPKLKSQLEKAEADYESVKAGKKSAPKASKQVKSTMDKLKQIIKKKKYGAYRAQGVDLKKDADIPALPTGKRISKSGNTYYEYRANRIDVKQPPKRYPKLEDGGETSTKKFNTKYNVGKAKYVINYHDGKKTHKDGSPFYDLATFKNMKDFMTYKKKLKSEGYKEYKDGGYMAKGGKIFMMGTEEVYIKKSSIGLEGEVCLFYKKDDSILKCISQNQFNKFIEDGKLIPKMEDGGYMAKGGETAKFEVDDVVFHKGHKTIGIVRMGEERGEVKTDADGNVNVSELEYYNPLKHEAHKNAKVAPSTLKEIEERMLWKPFSERTSQLEKGGYMADGGMVNIDDIEVGDYVNFGQYGNFYVVNTDYLLDGTHFWVTRDKKNRTNSDASGYSIYKDDAKYIVEKYSESDDEENEDDYMADGGTIDNSGMTPADLQNQIWNLTARIAKLGDIESRAASYEIEMLMKQRKKLQSMALNHGDVVMAQGGELHRSQEEKFKYGGYMAGGNTDKTQEIFFFVKPRLVSELTEKANNEKVELEFIETNEDGNEVYRAELTDSQINDFTKLPLQYDFNYDYAKGGYMADGGEIKDQYEGREPEDIWNSLSKMQRSHFLFDHASEIEARRGEDKGELKGKEISDAMKMDFDSLDKYIRITFENHIREGQYKYGGYMAMGGALEHGIKKGDHIMVVRGNMLGIKNEITGEIVTLNIETGERKESKD